MLVCSEDLISRTGERNLGKGKANLGTVDVRYRTWNLRGRPPRFRAWDRVASLDAGFHPNSHRGFSP